MLLTCTQVAVCGPGPPLCMAGMSSDVRGTLPGWQQQAPVHHSQGTQLSIIVLLCLVKRIAVPWSGSAVSEPQTMPQYMPQYSWAGRHRPQGLNAHGQTSFNKACRFKGLATLFAFPLASTLSPPVHAGAVLPKIRRYRLTLNTVRPLHITHSTAVLP